MKTEATESVVHEWIADLPFSQQALLMLSLRGPDGMPKYTAAKFILYYVRHCILKPAYPYDKCFEPGGFMRGDFENFYETSDQFFNDVDALPHHFIMHLIHATQVIGHNYYDINDSELSKLIRNCFTDFYRRACHSLHMNPETLDEMNRRLKR